MNERFNTRTGMMLAMLGMAVGTGNIWRFPRIAAKNGGGEFLVAWFFFPSGVVYSDHNAGVWDGT
jgi:NSS family neurotransmitter:Na+ symporter